jgi:hypothetical protein
VVKKLKKNKTRNLKTEKGYFNCTLLFEEGDFISSAPSGGRRKPKAGEWVEGMDKDSDDVV